LKGHYSGKNRRLEHDLNDITDDLATQHLNSPPTGLHPQRLPLAPPGFKVQLLHNHSVITSKWYTTMSKQKHNESLKQYILKKTKCHPRLFDKVDWEAHQSAFRRLTRFQQIGIAKIIHNLANTNRQNSLLYHTSSLCPLCQMKEETFEHVLTCSDTRTSKHRDEQFQQLKVLKGYGHTYSNPEHYYTRFLTLD